MHETCGSSFFALSIIVLQCKNKAKCRIKKDKKQLRPSQKQCKLKDALAENAQEENEFAEAAHPVAATEPQSHPAELLNQYKYP